MIEVLFGESEAAAMKAAKCTTVSGHLNGPTSVWMKEEKTPPERTFSGWVNGTSDEVMHPSYLRWSGKTKVKTVMPF